MFLFVAVQAIQRGVHTATYVSAADTTLVVYREDRFCPFTSRLPQYYLPQIEQIEGVRSVVPVKVVVNNCRASLDVVTFRGVPRDRFAAQLAPGFHIIEGSVSDWKRRSDSALLGETLAKRRGLKTGDRFDAAGVTSYVAGVIRSDEPQDQNVAYVHLDFLQQTVDRKLGVVTQFNVKVDDPDRLDTIAASIDEVFATAEQPTTTRSEKAFVAQVAADMIELVERASSCDVYSVLKRIDEKCVTEKGFANPKFVEDIVRDIAKKLKTDDNITWFSVSAESFESIHNHSAYAYITSGTDPGS